MRKLSSTLAMVVAVAVTAPACSGANNGPHLSSIKPQDMPDGGDWTGVYFSELFGFLHLVKEGSGVSGKWIRPGRDKWGELHGSVVGNVLRFSWTEYVVDLVGPGAKKSGKGVLRYTRPKGENVDDRLDGSIGYGLDETGTPWDALKQRNMNPDLESIGGNGSPELSGDWDKATPQGAVEPPAESSPIVPPPAPIEEKGTKKKKGK